MEPNNHFKRVRQFLTDERHLAPLSRLQSLFDSFSITEKAVFLAFAAIFALGALALASQVNSRYMVKVPARGGELSEGVMGTPRFINPLLALSDADRDLTALVYSGLLRATPEGDYEPDLAERYTVSPDGLSYTFVLRDGISFHDGAPVTADDIIYTVAKAQDSILKSPRRVNWEGVSVEKVGEKEVIFKLKQPYAPFIANLSQGILPRHIWKNSEADQFTFSLSNLDAVGSGPYIIDGIEKDRDGIPTRVALRANPDYALGKPYIEKLFFRFYPNETALIEALDRGVIDSAGNIGPDKAADIPGSKTVLRAPLTRIFGIFWNQSEKEILARKEVRKALSLSIDREKIISDVLRGYGTAADGPLPPTLAEKYLSGGAAGAAAASMDDARAALEKAGWKKDESGIYGLKTKSGTVPLSLSLSTANIKELVDSARIIESSWKELGVEVDVRIFEPSDLNQSVIRPRKYESLLFGIVTGRSPDMYPFWHSSQRNDPGLNIALYTNAKVDKALETMRTATDELKSREALLAFEKEIAADNPAIFLWSPDFIYAIPERLRGVKLGEITTPSDRFLDVHNWYVETDEVWRVFAGDREEKAMPNATDI